MPSGAKAAGAGPADVRLPGWNAGQVERAVQSLLKYVGKQHEASTSLLEDEDEVRRVRGSCCSTSPGAVT